jgi:hypothetical protein
MEPLTVLLASTLISLIIAGAVLWLATSWIGTRLRDGIQAEYDQKLAAQRARWEALQEVERRELLGPERTRKNDVLLELCARWVSICDCIAECGLTRRRSIEHARFAYRETFRRELAWFDDYFRPRRAFLDAEAAGRVAQMVERLRSEERELTGTLRDENVDDAEAHRAIVKTFDAMSTESAAIAELFEETCRAALQA